MNSIGEQPTLRVLQVCARYLPELGGVERHVAEVARRLGSEGIDSAVLTTDASGDLPRAETIDGVAVRRVPAKPMGSDVRFAPGVGAEIRDGQWDVVHVQGIHTFVAPLAMLGALRAGIPFVVTFHTGGHPSRLRRWIRPVQWLALRPLLVRAARLIAVSRFEEELFRTGLRLAPSRFVVIPNGAEIALEPSTNGIVPDPDLVVSVGRLERYKGHHRLIAALPYLADIRPGARLRIVGDGPYRAHLLEIAAELGVSDRVEIASIGSNDRAALGNLLASAGAVALLSDYEAHPVAVLEALAVGRPVLVADTSGLAEIAADGLATSIDPDARPADTARALAALAVLPTRPGAALPTWSDTTARLADVYRRAAIGRA
jgi:glycosyltransferase involved in cell wall biosynthesis